MEFWEDQGIILSCRSHGEHGAVVSVLTKNHGRHCGYVRGIKSAKMREAVELGTLVDIAWTARVSDELGSYNLETLSSYASTAMNDRLRLSSLISACALCERTLPERVLQSAAFSGLDAFLQTLSMQTEVEIWGAAYVMWEIGLLRELGFALDLSKCAGGGDSDTLAYVSPRTGRAVSEACGRPYKGKLLLLPEFLRPCGGGSDPYEISIGLKLTGYFLEHWAMIHSNYGLPDARNTLVEKIGSLHIPEISANVA